MWRPYLDYRSLDFIDESDCKIGISIGNIVSISEDAKGLTIITDYGSSYYIDLNKNDLYHIRSLIKETFDEFNERGVSAPLVKSLEVVSWLNI